MAFLYCVVRISAVAEQVSRQRVDVIEMRQRGVAKSPRLVIAAAIARPHVASGFPGYRRILSLRLIKHYCAALLPVAASTTMAPVMYGCTEQKYWYAPGVVKVNENLSPVSSAFDLKSFVLEATVCGTSSSLIQVTVVPAFTATRCGMKACWSIFTSVSAACAEAAGKANAAERTATASAVAIRTLLENVVMIRMSRLSPPAACR